MSTTIKRGRVVISAQALIGAVLENCTIQKLIGQGEMSAVFLAQQSNPSRQVAVKVLMTATAQAPDQKAAFLERFRHEVAAITSLKHQNILSVYEYGEHDGLPYLIMPYIEEATLRAVLDQEGQLALPKVANYLDQLAGALDFAQERGILHRNMRPV